MAAYAVHGYCPTCNAEKQPYGGRFFAPVTDTRALRCSRGGMGADDRPRTWSAWWPGSVLPHGFMTHKSRTAGHPNRTWVHALVDHVQC